jgi:electron transport protein HydN
VAEAQAIAQQFVHCEPNLCVGCEICAWACADVKVGTYDVVRSRIRLVRLEPDTKRPATLTLACRACADAPCVAACPYPGSLVVDADTGIPHVVSQVCTGCGWCIPACPFGVIASNPATKIVEICDLCEGRPEGPACVEVCPKDALSVITPEIINQRRRRQVAERIGECLLWP